MPSKKKPTKSRSRKRERGRGPAARVVGEIIRHLDVLSKTFADLEMEEVRGRFYEKVMCASNLQIPGAAWKAAFAVWPTNRRKPRRGARPTGLEPSARAQRNWKDVVLDLLQLRFKTAKRESLRRVIDRVNSDR